MAKAHKHAICMEEFGRLYDARLLPCCFCTDHNCNKGTVYVGPIPKDKLPTPTK